MLFAACFGGFKLAGPDLVVQIFADKIEANSEHTDEHNETDTLRQCKHLQNWIDPSTRFVFDDMNPNHIQNVKNKQSSNASFAIWIFTERYK